MVGSWGETKKEFCNFYFDNVKKTYLLRFSYTDMETSIDFLNPQHIQHKTAENPIFGPMFLSPLEQPCFHLRCLNVNTATMQPLLPDEVFIIFRLGVAGRSCRELLPISFICSLHAGTATQKGRLQFYWLIAKYDPISVTQKKRKTLHCRRACSKSMKRPLYKVMKRDWSNVCLWISKFLFNMKMLVLFITYYHKSISEHYNIKCNSRNGSVLHDQIQCICVWQKISFTQLCFG